MIQLKGNKYIVTGGAGFIGSHIAEEIVKQGKQVVVIDDLSAGKKENLEGWWNSAQCEFIHEDIHILLALYEAFAGADAVFHNAASKCSRCIESPYRDILVNASDSIGVFLSAHNYGLKVIHASTGSVNDGAPVSYYGVSKLAAEKYLPVIKGYHPDFRYTILRYYHVYGPRQDDSDKGGVIPIFARNIREGNPIRIFGDGKQVRHFTWVKDVVNANFFAANEDKTDGDTYNVVSDVKVSIQTLAWNMMQLTGWENSVPIVYEPERPGDIKHFNISNGDILQAGFPGFTKGFKEGLKETMFHYSVPQGAIPTKSRGNLGDRSKNNPGHRGTY